MELVKKIGAYTYYGDEFKIIGVGTLEIGKFCSIGSDVTIIIWGHNTDWFSTYPFGAGKTPDCQPNPKHPVYGKVIIGNDVWIGSNTTIVYNSKIGDGAIVAAGSLVNGKVKPYTVVGGNPAQLLYTRFNKETIDLLKRLKWWDLDYNIIKKYAMTLQSKDINKLLQFYNEVRGAK
jgi:acetyltransferase-like isoleucine patch superfamily enzyme